jgi:hypothetical protein
MHIFMHGNHAGQHHHDRTGHARQAEGDEL